MQEEGIFARMATGATDRGSWREMGHGVAAGLGCGMKRGAMLETHFLRHNSNKPAALKNR